MLGIYHTYEFDDVWFWIGVDQSRCAKYKLFLGVFKERISDCWKQGWDDRIQEHDCLPLFFKLDHTLESYVDYLANTALRDAFVRFRMGISEIKTHNLRYSTDHSDDLSCPFCQCHLQDEIHFLFLCKATES